MKTFYLRIHNIHEDYISFSNTTNTYSVLTHENQNELANLIYKLFNLTINIIKQIINLTK